ncbi:hypothetical protein [Halovivax cerinus]|uniref:Uncharacterized protein n=1 Tax=Halovivax cerinus TaxID=1487865 RepID=A0ABD5NPR1_9EURY|nr:hypothetical protein [Halovivax cerinus]
MRSVDRATATSSASGEGPCTRECYRCDRDVDPDVLFRISVEPPGMLSKRYGDAVRYCCEHCAAAMNLSEFSEQVKRHARRGGRPPAE